MVIRHCDKLAVLQPLPRHLILYVLYKARDISRKVLIHSNVSNQGAYLRPFFYCGVVLVETNLREMLKKLKKRSHVIFMICGLRGHDLPGDCPTAPLKVCLVLLTGQYCCGLITTVQVLRTAYNTLVVTLVLTGYFRDLVRCLVSDVIGVFMLGGRVG